MMDWHKLTFREFVEVSNIIDGYTTPDLHARIIEWLENTDTDPSRLLMVFRDAAKSHLVCLYAAWRLRRNRDDSIVIISAKRELAARNAAMIRAIIETNPLCSDMIGTNADKWGETKFNVRGRRAQLNNSIACSSMVADFTGLHGNLVLGDDIETSANSQSQEGRDKLRRRIHEFRKIAPQVMFVGTPHHSDSLYDYLPSIGFTQKLTIPVHDANGEPAWRDHPMIIREADEDGNILRSYRKFSRQWIEITKARSPAGDWLSQYMLVPATIEPSVMNAELADEYLDEIEYKAVWQGAGKPDAIEFKIGARRLTQYVCYFDPASATEGRDRSVVAIVGVSEVTKSEPDPFFYVHRVIELPPLDTDTGWQPQIDKLAQIVKDYYVPRIYFEKSVNLAFASDVRRTFNRRGLSCPMVDVQRAERKEKFIARYLEPILKSGRMLVHKSVALTSHFYGELADFPRSKNDDCIDAVAGGFWRVQHHIEAMPKKVERAVFSRVGYGQHEGHSYLDDDA